VCQHKPQNLACPLHHRGTTQAQEGDVARCHLAVAR
jgi:hypothetical protein